jgi:hypothetical protein
LEPTLEDHSTFPAILAAETVPVPLADRPAPRSAEPASASAWPGLALKLAAAGMGLWLLKHWW